jgi:hypothetical protein
MDSDWAEVEKQALDIYEETMCRGAGCCGSIDTALAHMRAVAEIREHERDQQITALRAQTEDQEGRIRYLRDLVADLKDKERR